MMTPRERAEAALNLQIPDMVPTFELEFQLAEEMFGKPFLTQRDLEGKSASERDRLIKENAEYMLEVYEALEYSIIPLHYLNLEGLVETARHIRRLTGDRFMLTAHGDGTYAIPSGSEMMDFVYFLTDQPDEAKAEAQRNAQRAIERIGFWWMPEWIVSFFAPITVSTADPSYLRPCFGNSLLLTWPRLLRRFAPTVPMPLSTPMAISCRFLTN